jgi:hypothetical protein
MVEYGTNNVGGSGGGHKFVNQSCQVASSSSHEIVVSGNQQGRQVYVYVLDHLCCCCRCRCCFLLLALGSSGGDCNGILDGHSYAFSISSEQYKILASQEFDIVVACCRHLVDCCFTVTSGCWCCRPNNKPDALTELVRLFNESFQESFEEIKSFYYGDKMTDLYRVWGKTRVIKNSDVECAEIGEWALKSI